MAAPMSGATARTRYRGRTALHYEARRAGQGRWRREHEAVAAWLPSSGSVLDVPVGTGRFIPLYRERGLRFTGLDVSYEMVALAEKKLRRDDAGSVSVGDVFRLPPARHDFVVCVRLLHLISWEETRVAMRGICTIARAGVILTVRLDAAGRQNPSSVTHAETPFRRLVKRLGWSVREERLLSRQGWRVMLLARD
jgi:SAM-dependent methyltransferase